MEKRTRRARPAGIFRWRRRLGIVDNVAQVAEELHVRYGLSVERSWRVVLEVQRELGEAVRDPRALWRACKARMEGGRER